MEKEKVLGVITVPVTIENVMENKKPELPDDIWQQMKADLQQACKIETAEPISEDAECLIVDIDGEEIEKKKVLVMKTIVSVFDCNIIAARNLTNTLVLYGRANTALNISKEDFLPVLFQNAEKWKVLRETLKDLTRILHRGSKETRVPAFTKAPFDICFC